MPELKTDDARDPAYGDQLLETIDELGCRGEYDAIIADEGQDFVSEWWLALEELLDDDGVFYIFYDDNQAIYRSDEKSDWPIDQEPVVLTKTCRSTKNIHEKYVRFYRGDEKPDCLGPSGIEPDFRYDVRVSDTPKALGKTLHRLIVDEGHEPDEITVLTPRGEHKSSIKDGQEVGNYTLRWNIDNRLTEGGPRRGNEVSVSTIHRFKGLESRVVVLAELEELDSPYYREHPRNRLELLYVGLSRAKVRLVVLGGEPEWFEDEETVEVVGKEPVEYANEHMAAASDDSIDSGSDDTDTEDVESEEQERGREADTPSEGLLDAVFLRCDEAAMSELIRREPDAVPLDEPRGVLTQYRGSSITSGEYEVVEWVTRLPFTRDAWHVRVRREE